MKLKVLLGFILTFGLFQIVFGQEVVVTREGQRGYLVGPGDEITGKVMNEPQFDFVATIDDDGKFQVPFFDKTIEARCRTEKELRSEVTQLLSKYLKNPQISVRVTQRKSRPPVVVTGEVRAQQQVELRREARLLELISFAGGETGDAGGMVQIFRTTPPICAAPNEKDEWMAESNNGTDVPSRLYSLSSLRLGREEANPIIYPGDVIVVQKASPVYITGEVVAPQGILLKGGGTSLTEAIAKIGGVRREAKTKDIKIYRLKANSKEREIIAVNYDLIKKGTQKDVMLEPYDIVEVDKSKKSIAQITLELITGVGRQGLGAVTSGLGQRVLY
ncbi:MAG: SLBB domain-containing protein [Acidobacteria bacterium]|nr:SLBB domain-containing protein [Acidobacteriota bacterium]